MDDTVAILCSDIHFSHNPPVAGSVEPNWYAAMDRQWNEVYEISDNGKLPIIIAGDVFDRWNSPPELINFVIETFSQFSDVLTVAGQHDLPNHSYEERHRSAYGTLERSEVITNVRGVDQLGARVIVYGFSWGQGIEGIEEKNPDYIHVAICHAFICFEPSFPGSEDKTINKYLPKLQGYDAVVFGDNHSGFKYWWEESATILNCGTFYRRHADEIDYRPQIGLLQSDGSVQVHYLDVSQDKFLSRTETKQQIEDTAEFHQLMRELRELGSDSLDFHRTINRYMEQHDTDPVVKELVLEIIG